MANDYEMKLRQLNCHFNWGLEKKLNNKRPSDLIMREEHLTETGPDDGKVASLLFMSYLYTISEIRFISPYGRNYAKALEKVSEADVLWRSQHRVQTVAEDGSKSEVVDSGSCIKDDFCIAANRLHIRYKLLHFKDPDELEKLLERQKNLLDDKALALSVEGLKGLALMRMGHGENYYNLTKCKQLFTDAYMKDKSQTRSFWLHKLLTISGRLRRLDFGVHVDNSKIERDEERWNEVIRLRQFDHHCRIEYASFLTEGPTGRIEKHIKEISDHFNFGLRMFDKSYLIQSLALKICTKMQGRGWSRREWWHKKLQDLVEEAEKLDGYKDSGIYRDLANFYRQRNNLDKATKYYEKSLTDSLNFEAMLEFAKFGKDKIVRLSSYSVLLDVETNFISHVRIRMARACYLIDLDESGKHDDFIIEDLMFAVEHDNAFKTQSNYIHYEHLGYNKLSKWTVAGKILEHLDKRIAQSESDVDTVGRLRYYKAWFLNNLYPCNDVLVNSRFRDQFKSDCKKKRRQALKICSSLPDTMNDVSILKADILLSLQRKDEAKKLLGEIKIDEANHFYRKVKGRLLLHKIRTILYKSNSQVASQTVEEELQQLALMGFADEFLELLELLEQICYNNFSFVSSKDTQKFLLSVRNNLEKPEFLDKASICEHASAVLAVTKRSDNFYEYVSKLMKNNDDLKHLHALRMSRYKLLDKDRLMEREKATASDLCFKVLSEAKQILDYVHREFGILFLETLGSKKGGEVTVKEKSNFGFPLLLRTDTRNTDELVKKAICDKLKAQKLFVIKGESDDLNLVEGSGSGTQTATTIPRSPHTILENLKNFLSTLFSEPDSVWINKWVTVVNDAKHESPQDCGSEEWIDIAHKAADITEVVVRKYTKLGFYVKSCLAVEVPTSLSLEATC